MKPDFLYHCTTPKKLERYKATGHIIPPVRGFSTHDAAKEWCRLTGRTIILKIPVKNKENCHKLPDHHNKFGLAYWLDDNCNYEKVEI